MDSVISSYSQIDSLPGIDKDHEDTFLKVYIQELISNEMKQFEPPDYLRQFENLMTEDSLNKSIFKIEHSATVTSTKIELSNFQTNNPQESVKNLRVWDNVIKQAQVNNLHLENQLLNLETMESNSSKPFLVHNNKVELLSRFYSEKAKQAGKRLFEIQKSRQDMQEKLLPQLMRFQRRKGNAVVSRLSCDRAYMQLMQLLQSKGFDYDQFLNELEQSQDRQNNPNDSRYNSTVREYETVNETEALEPATKRAKN